jgi:hypothetical protein
MLGTLLGSAVLQPLLDAYGTQTVMYVCAVVSIWGLLWTVAFIPNYSVAWLVERDHNERQPLDKHTSGTATAITSTPIATSTTPILGAPKSPTSPTLLTANGRMNGDDSSDHRALLT